MRRSPGGQLAFLGSILFAVLPFVFGAVRAAQTGSDYRLLWMAAASAVGALAVRRITRPGSGAIVLLASSLLAAAAGLLLGATAGPGVWMVAVTLGLCWATSRGLEGWAARHA